MPDERLSPASAAGAGARARFRRLRRHGAWICVALAYLTVFPYYARVNNPNENVRIWMTRAIVEFHELNLNRASATWGYVNDKAVVSGRLYSSKAPGTSLLGVPIYAAQRAVARLFGAQPSPRAITLGLRFFGVGVPLAIFLFFFARWAERVTGSSAARDLLVVALGLGSILYPYGVIFVGHALAAALAFSSFMLLSLEAPGAARRGRLAWAGALAGAAVIFEYQAGIAAVVVAAYALARHRRAALWFALGALPAVAAFGLYHAVVFGRPWELPFGHLENPQWAELHKQVGRPDPRAVGGVLFSIDMGLFIFSPYLLLGVLGALVALAREERLAGAVILAVSGGLVCFLATLPNWHAGWCVGPRYISAVAPFMTAGLAYAWRAARRPFVLSALAAGLVVPSVALNVVSGAVYPHYPEVFDNPVFDLTLPLIRDGYVPYSLGWLLGLRRAWSLLPLALLSLAALALALRGEDARPRRRLAHGALALVVAAAFLVPLSRYGRKPSPAESAAAAFVRATWEPPPTPAAARTAKSPAR
ncbi:MAG TPA: hypothetical protein VHL80_03355 [Polyangia bacterium]|nr:hypothetical protein [Polyangia bacterium]